MTEGKTPDYWSMEDLNALLQRVRTPLVDKSRPVPALVGFVVLASEILQWLHYHDTTVGLPAEFEFLQLSLTLTVRGALENLHRVGMMPDIVGQIDQLAAIPPTNSLH